MYCEANDRSQCQAIEGNDVYIGMYTCSSEYIHPSVLDTYRKRKKDEHTHTQFTQNCVNESSVVRRKITGVIL